MTRGFDVAGVEGGQVSLTAAQLRDLGAAVEGDLLCAGDEGWEEAVRIWNGMAAKQPALVVQPTTPRDVAAAVDFARDNRLLLSVKGGGHHIAGTAIAEGGLMLDMGRMREVTVDPDAKLGEPVVDLLGEQPYVQIQSYLDDTEPDDMHYYWKTEYALELNDGLLETVRELFAACPIPGADIGFLHLGGALNERPWDDGAVGNRDVRFAMGIKGMWAPDEPRAEEFRQWLRDAWRRSQPFTAGRTYVNFQTADEEEDRVRGAYGANFGRLEEVKSKYDPSNLFRANRNIRPLGRTITMGVG